MTTSQLVNSLGRALALVSWLLASTLAPADAHAASLSVYGTLTQGPSSSSCTYASLIETLSGDWTVNCGSGINTITINPKLCGSVCTSYSGLVEDARGNWTVNGCVASLSADVNLTAPASPIASLPLGSTYRLKATAAGCTVTISKVEFLANGALIANSAITAPPYEFDWTPTVAGNTGIQARATDAAGGVTLSQTVNVYVNAPPAVAISVTSPGTLASPPGPRAAPASFVLSATASDSNGIGRVEFWSGSTQVGTGSGASAQATWTGVAAGTYNVIARAFDSLGASADSAPVTVTVTASNHVPTVSLSSPTAGATSGAPLTMQATAGDDDGNVVRVEFVDSASGAVVGTATTGPTYTAQWANPGSGQHTIFARAIDNSGGQAMTGTVTITVTQPFRIKLNSAPASSPFYVAPASVRFTLPEIPDCSAVFSQLTLYMDNVAQGAFMCTFTATGIAWEATVSLASAGTHHFNARATVAADGSTGVSNDVIVTIDPTSPPLAPNACFPESTNGTIPGTMAGGAGVGDSGAATYSIPIQVPPGTAGVAPALGISYNSQGGNGLLGVGWSLQGLSVIHRCPQNVFTDGVKGAVTYAQPNTQPNTQPDPVCLDGQRLVPVSGSDRNGTIEYRTERESYSRIQSFNPLQPSAWVGPAYFKVWTKSGQVLWYGLKYSEVSDPYGAPQDAVVRTSPIGSAGKETARSWALYRIEDRLGNYVLIDYGTSNQFGTMRPSMIRYTGNSVQRVAPANRVQFYYEARLGAEVHRDDAGDLVAAIAYDAGGQSVYETMRLASIVTFADESPVKSYTFGYRTSLESGRSILQSAQECSGDGQLCLNPTTFQFTEAEGGANRFNFGSSVWQGPARGDPLKDDDRRTTVAVDIDGDGKTDLVSRADHDHSWDVCKSTGSNYICEVWTSNQRAKSDGSDDVWHFADFDGDGKADLVFLAYSETGFILQLSTGSGFGSPLFAPTSWKGIDPGLHAYAHAVGDFDGDGRADLALYMGDLYWSFCSYKNSQFACSPSVYVAAAAQPSDSPDSGFDFLVADFNGDGRADFAFHSNNGDQWAICLSKSQVGVFSFDCGPLTTAIADNAYRVHIADMNGDGLSDLLAPDPASGVGKWNVCLSRGDKTFACSRWSGPNVTHEYALLGDFNGDGRTDIMWWQPYGPAGYRVALSTGKDFDISSGIWSTSAAPAERLENVRVGDFNGDGKSDIAAWTGGANSTWNVGLATGSPTDMLRRATNGLNAAIVFTYKPLTDGTVYAKESTAQYPEIDIQPPMYVVSRMETSTMVSSQPWFALDYSYRGLKGHTQGPGLAGFKGRVVVDGAAQLCSETETETVWNERRVGLPKHITKRYRASIGIGACPGGTALSDVTNTWQSRKSNTFNGLTDAWSQPPQNLPIFEAFMTASNETRKDLSGADMKSSSMSSPIANMDVFGNPKSVSSSASDGYGKSTTSSFLNNPSNWIVGRVTQTSVTNSVPYATVNNNPTRLSSFGYDTNTGLLTSETIEPNRSGTSDYLNTTYAYDAFGNRQSTTVSGQGVNRTTTTRYCSAGTASSNCPVDGRFPTYQQNSVGHLETRVYDRRFGVVSQQTGPNGLTSAVRIDKMGRKFCETRPDGSTTGWTWAAGGDGNAYFASTSDSTGARTQRHVDGLGREVALKATAFDSTAFIESWSTVSTRYDYRGRKISVTKPSGGNENGSTFATATFEFDDLNRPTMERGELGYLATHAYNGMTSSLTVTGQSGPQTTQKTLNSRGEVVEVLDANFARLQLQYDHFGNLEKKAVVVPGSDAGSPTTTLIYFNTRGQKTSSSDPDQGYWTYLYNALGEMTQQKDALNQVSAFAYDDLGRMSIRNEPGRTTTWTYDSLAGSECGSKTTGKLCQVKRDSYTQNYQYDDLGRLASVKQSSRVTGVFQRFTTYDGMSRVRKIIYPVTGLTLLHTYNDAGYLATITEPAASVSAHWSAISRFADGQIYKQLVRGAYTTRTYDALGRPATIETPSIQKAAYTFDPLGNLTSRSDSSNSPARLSETFEYDSLNRLTKVSGPSPRTYQYDSLGNLKFRSDLGVLTYNPGTHRLATAGGVTYNYDNNGNFTSTSNSSQVVYYTPFGMPLSVTSNATTPSKGYSYEYDGNHQRVAEWGVGEHGFISATFYFSDGNTPFFEEYQDYSDPDSDVVSWKHYVNTPEGVAELIVVNGDAAGTRNDSLLIRDHLGSTVAVLPDGVPEQLGYDAWGKRRNANGTDNPAATSAFTDRGFTGHEMMDDVGLVNMNGRIYNPTLGRFLQPDPIVQAPFNLQSYNRYSYVLNNPLSYTDPTGYSFWTKYRRPIFAISAAAIIGPWAGGEVMWALAPTSANAAAIGAVAGGAAAGFAAGGIMGGNIQSAVYGAFSGAISGGVSGYFGNSYTLTRVGAEAFTGGVSSAIRGGSFRDGFRSSLAFSLVTYGAMNARAFELEHSQRTPGQVGDSPGFRGSEGKVAGGRINRDLWDEERFGPFDSSRDDWSSAVAKYRAEISPSPLGCHQGGPGCIFNRPYAPGGIVDKSFEAFGGVHDLLNHLPFYNADGTSHNFLPQLGRIGSWAGELINGANVFIASPIVAISVIPDEARWVLTDRRRR